MAKLVRSNRALPDTDFSEFQLDEWPFFWLTRVVGLYLQQMEIALKKIDLDVPRWRVLKCLESDSAASISELAELAIVKLPTMTKIIQRMQSEGLIESYVRPTDGRVTEVRLTPEGQIAQTRAWDIAQRVYSRAFGSISAKEITQLNAILQRVFTEMDR